MVAATGRLIVMGTICRSGLLVGKTAEKVLQHLGTSQLIVKLEGFVTPVAG
jgi:nucleotide-binding universal stress UspA family protein